MQATQALEVKVEEEVIQNLRFEAEDSGKTVQEVAAERLRARPYTGMGTRIANRFKGVGLKEGEAFPGVARSEPRVPDFS